MRRSKTSATYLKTKIMTASPGELMVMMYNGAVNFCERAREKMLAREFSESCDLIVRAENILMELSAGLRKDVYPELVGNLARLFEFVFHRLFEANVSQDPQKLLDAVGVLTVLRDTWIEAIQKEADAPSESVEQPPATGLELSA